MASVTFKRGTRAEIEATAKQDGQILMETDQNKKNKMYIDLPDGSRVLIGNSGEAIDTSYDNTTSGLDATNVQSAIDELNSNLNSVLHPSSIILLGSLKVGQNINIDLTQYTYLLLSGVESKIIPVAILTEITNFGVNISRVVSSSYFSYQFVMVTPSKITYNSEYRSGWGDDISIITIYGVK